MDYDEPAEQGQTGTVEAKASPSNLKLADERIEYRLQYLMQEGQEHASRGQKARRLSNLLAKNKEVAEIFQLMKDLHMLF